MKKILVLLVFVASLTLAACAGTSNGQSNMAVNSKCPMMPDHPIDPDVTVDFKGAKVAFCCEKCVGGWNKLDNAGKQAKLTAAK